MMIKMKAIWFSLVVHFTSICPNLGWLNVAQFFALKPVKRMKVLLCWVSERMCPLLWPQKNTYSFAKISKPKKPILIDRPQEGGAKVLKEKSWYCIHGWRLNGRWREARIRCIHCDGHFYTCSHCSLRKASKNWDCLGIFAKCRPPLFGNPSFKKKVGRAFVKKKKEWFKGYF